jgi:hypothetical protein
MPERIAIIDRRIMSQADDVYRRDYGSWVTGARRTLEVERDSNRRLIDWVVEAAGELGPPVDLDMIAHGAGGHVGTSTDVIYVLRLGTPGIYSVNVHQWEDVRGLIRKIRVYSCGVESTAFPAGTFSVTSSASQHQLMKALAARTGATVKYSLNTMSGDVNRHELSQSYSTDRMASPVFIADPTGGARRIR